MVLPLSIQRVWYRLAVSKSNKRHGLIIQLLQTHHVTPDMERVAGPVWWVEEVVDVTVFCKCGYHEREYVRFLVDADLALLQHCPQCHEGYLLPQKRINLDFIELGDAAHVYRRTQQACLPCRPDPFYLYQKAIVRV